VNSNVTFRVTNLVSASGNTINISGTSGDDLFVFLPGSTAHRVAVNGVGYDYNAATYSNITLQDNGGIDTLVAVGTSQDEATVGSQSGVTIASSSYSFVGTGVELVQAYAGSGNDTATFYDRS